MERPEPDIAEVYTAANSLEAHFLKNLLENAGIEARVVGDQLQIAGGELPIGWAGAPRIWVPTNDGERARQILREWEAKRQASGDTQSWICPRCEEEVPAGFGDCWNCEYSRTQTTDVPGI